MEQYRPRQGKVSLDNAYKTFCPHKGLADMVQCFWQLSVPSGRFSYLAFPDNCVDLIFSSREPDLPFVAPPSDLAVEFDMQGPATYFGIRLHLLGYLALGLEPLGDAFSRGEFTLTDSGIKHDLAFVDDRVKAGQGFFSTCTSLEHWLTQHRCDINADRRLIHFLRLQLTTPSSSLRDTCLQIGVTERHLRRLSHLYTGLRPKALHRVYRFQHQLLGDSVVSAMSDAYYDQSHLIRECKALTGMTPEKLKSMSVLYNTPS